jgi:hypothetical protein
MIEPSLIARIEFDELSADQVAALEQHPLAVRGPFKPNKSLPIWECGFQVSNPDEVNDVAQEVHVWAVRQGLPFRRLITDQE